MIIHDRISNHVHATIRLLIVVGIILFLAGASAFATTYSIGPTRSLSRLSSIAGQLKPGDTVEIDPGVYKDVLKITANGTRENPIVIRGVGKDRPLFDASGQNVSGRGSIPRAIFQIEGAYIIVEHLEFKNARNGNNGAGIRLNSSSHATIRDCKISYCDMGIQGGDRETAMIEQCDIGFNGTRDYNGYSHNFYMMGNQVVVKQCFIHDSLYGQNFKSRAHYNELWYNWIMDSNEGEVGPVDGKGATDRPHSNTVLVGNVIVSKAERTGNKAKYVLMGTESGGSHQGTLFAFFNIFASHSSRVQFIQLDDSQTHADIRYNIFYGSNHIVRKTHPSSVVSGDRNWVLDTAQVPEGWIDTYRGTSPGFADPQSHDYRLTPDSPLFHFPVHTIEYRNGEGEKVTTEIDAGFLQRNRRFKHFLSFVKTFEWLESQ